jgi:nickel/cobalt transporter (NiCoT) family protein
MTSLQWTSAERVRPSGFVSVVVALYVAGTFAYIVVGLLFGLGLETASEVTLLSLQASTAAQGALPALAVLTLPLLFAAGMSTMDTADSLLMTRAYSWAYRQPARRLYDNLATTGMTVLAWGGAVLVWRFGRLDRRYTA